MNNYERNSFTAFRAEIDRLYPAASHLIAVRNQMTLQRPKLFAEDLEAQIDPAALNAYGAGRVEDFADFLKQISKVVRSSGQTLFATYHQTAFSLGRIKEQPDSKPLFSYVMTLPEGTSARKFYHSLSSREVGKFRMKFNEAAMDRDVLGWMVFYRNLAKAAMDLEQHGDMPAAGDKTQQAYQNAKDDITHDIMGALLTLQKCGAAAEPVVKTYADMHLSAFLVSGHEKFSGPALHEAVEKFQSAGPNWLADKSPDALFRIAAEMTERHCFSFDQFVKAESISNSHYDTPVKPYLFTLKMINQMEFQNRMREAVSGINDHVDHCLGRSQGLLHRDYAESPLPALAHRFREALGFPVKTSAPEMAGPRL